MSAKQGSWVSLSPPRQVLTELMHHARKVPSIPVAKRINVEDLANLRDFVPQRPSWTAIFMRAYGLVCQDFPVLRRTFLPWPIAHLYEHPHTVCKLAVERRWNGEDALFFGEIHAPEALSVAAIHEQIQHLKQDDVESIGTFRQLLRVGRCPALLRRLVFWKYLYLSGRKRAKRLGTFGLTNYGQLGCESLHPISPHTSLLSLGPVNEGGNVTVKLVYDHRVLDGAVAARCLNRLEEILHTEILGELRRAIRRIAHSPATDESTLCAASLRS